MELKTILLYLDTVGAMFDQLSDEQLGRFLRLCVTHARGALPGELDAIINGDASLGLAWAMYRPLLDNAAEKYRAKCEKAREAVNRRWAKIKAAELQPNTDEYGRIQPNTDEYYNNNKNSNNNDNENVCEDTPRAHTREQWCELFTGEQYASYREALAMTWRKLSPEQITVCIRRAIDWCEASGKSLDEVTLKRYINKECELASRKPAGSIDQRRQAFHEECRGLLQICDDKALVSQFFAEYSQPCNDGSGLMLFESMRAWDTVTRFKLYINGNNK